MKRPMSKRKTRNWPDMFPRRKRVFPEIPLQEFITVGGDCIHCISEPICKFN